MIRLLPLALLSSLLIPAARADAACGVPAGRATYETPDVQVYVTKGRQIACYRATGRPVVLGRDVDDGDGTRVTYTVQGVLGGRWLRVGFSSSEAEANDVSIESLVDLRTHHEAVSPVFGDETDNTLAVLPGVAVTAGGEGVTARFPGGRFKMLTPELESATDVAASGARVYWRDESGAARTALLDLPASDPVRLLPRARTVGRCRPRPGARLLVQDSTVVVTRAGGATWACRGGRTRRVGTDVDVSILSERAVAYTRPGFAGVLDLAGGRRRELPSAGGPLAVTGSALVAAATDGIRAWTTGTRAPVVLSAEAGRDLAAAEDGYGTVVYWLDATGTPQTRTIH